MKTGLNSPAVLLSLLNLERIVLKKHRRSRFKNIIIASSISRAEE